MQQLSNRRTSLGAGLAHLAALVGVGPSPADAASRPVRRRCRTKCPSERQCAEGCCAPQQRCSAGTCGVKPDCMSLGDSPCDDPAFCCSGQCLFPGSANSACAGCSQIGIRCLVDTDCCQPDPPGSDVPVACRGFVCRKQTAR